MKLTTSAIKVQKRPDYCFAACKVSTPSKPSIAKKKNENVASDVNANRGCDPIGEHIQRIIFHKTDIQRF